MGGRDGKSPPAIGFLTVVPHEQHGLFGGYLMLDPGGRPLEFHCTAPIKPNRAQEILFGPTLQSYVYGEQIGRTLVEAGRAQPLVICTDLAPVLALREHVELPVVLLAPADENESSSSAAVQHRIDAAHPRPVPSVSFRLGSHRLSIAAGFAEDQTLVSQRLASVAERMDLLEPFARIREAIDEAQRSGK